MQKTEKFRNAKVGDKVYSLRHGEGEIIIIRDNDSCPIVVEFPLKAHKASFSYNGFWLENDAMPMLYWSKPEIIEQPRYEEVEIEGYWYEGEFYSNENFHLLIAGKKGIELQSDKAKVIIKRKMN